MSHEPRVLRNREPAGRSGRAAACALLLVLGACSLFGPSFGDFGGATLRTAEAEGAEALERMQELPAVRGWVERNGKPDYVRADSDRRLVLFYLQRDLLVRFQRSAFSRVYRVTTSQPIRSDDNLQFTNDDRARLGRVRLGETGQEPVPLGQSEGVVRKRVGGDQEQGEGTLPVLGR